MENTTKSRAPRNRTLELTLSERSRLSESLLGSSASLTASSIIDRIACADSFSMIEELPRAFVDLLILDPPYNITKQFGDEKFNSMPLDEYEKWFEKWFQLVLPTLKPNASIYVCADWNSSSAVHRVLDRRVTVRNRITWEREKGRGAKSNWKNSSEDIWFATVSGEYVFNVEAVKLKRRVIAPYRHNGMPKDWIESEDGNFRLTHPSNIWTDLTVPFWSMPENTDHPTQKPEKLIAKLILASSHPGDIVFDPFLGSGTTAVVAHKLGRHFFGIEIDQQYACLAAKRVEIASNDRSVQGYVDGVFWERNSLNVQKHSPRLNFTIRKNERILTAQPR